MTRFTREFYGYLVMTAICLTVGYAAVMAVIGASIKDCHYAWCVEAAGE